VEVVVAAAAADGALAGAPATMTLLLLIPDRSRTRANSKDGDRDFGLDWPVAVLLVIWLETGIATVTMTTATGETQGAVGAAVPPVFGPLRDRPRPVRHVTKAPDSGQRDDADDSPDKPSVTVAILSNAATVLQRSLNKPCRSFLDIRLP
jgi:hypothetical protein